MINQKTYKSNESDNINMLPGDPKGSPDESYSEETLVFIDEAFLSKLSNYFGNGKYLKFDRFSFSKLLSEKERLKLNKSYLYIAPPFQSNPPTREEEIKKEGYDSLILKLKEKGIIIREGRCQRLKIDGKYHYNQKAVDILLAMDIMSVPTDYPRIKKIILIASDSDFVPVINKLKEREIKTILYTYYEKRRDSPFSRSNHLIKSVNKYVLLTKQDFEKAPLTK
jgi:uncharacterized LabA/DUF88 family protein